MKLDYPHIITEGNRTYRLGELTGDHVLYNFDKTYIYRKAKGKLMYGRQFKIDEGDRNIVFGFNHIGYRALEGYGNKQFFCFDDLGVEPTGRHFGRIATSWAKYSCLAINCSWTERY